MKKIMFLFSMMFTIMLAMSSCSTEETDLSETIAVNQINSLAIKKLQEYNEVLMAQKPVNGKDFKSEVDKQMVILNSFVRNGQFDVDNYMKANPIGDVKVENAIKEYFKLFTTYPENVDDLVRITNDYIENIELNNEFNDD